VQNNSVYTAKVTHSYVTGDNLSSNICAQHYKIFTVLFKAFVWVIKSRRIRWAGHVARMGEESGVYRVLVGKPEGKNHWGDLGVDGWIILGWICRRWDVGIWTGLGWPRIETGGGRL